MPAPFNPFASSHNSFKSFSQLQKLSIFCKGNSEQGGDILGVRKTSITEFDISAEGNPCAVLSLYREFCAFSMPKLDVLDGVAISPEERSRGMLLFAPLRKAGGDGSKGIENYSSSALFKTGGKGIGLFNRNHRMGNKSAKAAYNEDLKTARLTEKFITEISNLSIDRNREAEEFRQHFDQIMNEIVDEAFAQKYDVENFTTNCLETFCMNVS